MLKTATLARVAASEPRRCAPTLNDWPPNSMRSASACRSRCAACWSACRSRSRVAWLLTRRRLRGRMLLDAFVHLPLVLPPVVVGYLLLLVFGMRGPIGRWLYEQFGIQLVFTTAGAALATAVMTFPLMVRAIRISLEGVDPGLEDAARTLGAGAVGSLLHGHAAADAARHPRRRGHCVRGGARRVRRGDHLRFEHSRARRARCRWRCTRRCRRRTATRSLRASRRSRSRSACSACSSAELIARRVQRHAGALRPSMFSIRATEAPRRIHARRGDRGLDFGRGRRCSAARAAARRRSSTSSPACSPPTRRASRSTASCSKIRAARHAPAGRAASHRLRVPGRAAVSAPRCARQPALCRAARAARRASVSRSTVVVQLLGLEALLQPSRAPALGRRAAARRARPRTVVAAATAAARRAAGVARRRAARRSAAVLSSGCATSFRSR